MRCSSWVEIDWAGFRANLSAVMTALGAQTELVLVLKAEAYGHGMADAAREASAVGVRRFAVARLDEAYAMRAALPDAEVLLFGGVWPEDLPGVLAGRITPVLIDEAQGQSLAAAARAAGAALKCHVKVDTGMGRLGIPWADAAAAMRRLLTAGGLELCGVCTHFAAVDKAPDSTAVEQVRRFQSVLDGCRTSGVDTGFRHISNSAAFNLMPEWDLDGVRIGILAYGYGGVARVKTHPFLQWKTRVVQVKNVPAGFHVSYMGTHVTASPTCLATIDAGYSDGFNRLLSNCGCVLIGGRRAPVVGRVTMNFTVIDAGPEAAVSPGDEVVLLGRQGAEAIWADEMAQWCGTIPYEILTSIRSPRRKT
ncbi:MAG: alanine racemase [bacterium]